MRTAGRTSSLHLPPHSKSYQAVISKSSVSWALPPGWCTIKALLGSSRRPRETAAGSFSKLTSRLRRPVKNGFIFPARRLCFLSLTFLAVRPPLPSILAFTVFVTFIIQRRFCLAVHPVCSVSFGRGNTSC